MTIEMPMTRFTSLMAKNCWAKGSMLNLQEVHPKDEDALGLMVHGHTTHQVVEIGLPVASHMLRSEFFCHLI